MNDSNIINTPPSVAERVMTFGFLYWVGVFVLGHDNLRTNKDKFMKRDIVVDLGNPWNLIVF